MKKTLPAVLALGLAAALFATPASATDAATPEVCYGEPVLVTPATEEVPAVEAVYEVIEHAATYKDVETDPGQPFRETTYKQVLVKEATPAVPEESFIRYTYQKETMTTRQRKQPNVIDVVETWNRWAPASYKISDGVKPPVLETGIHATWKEGSWTYTRTYRYVPNGTEKKIITREAVPGTEAEYETVVDVPGQEYIPPTIESVVDIAAWTETKLVSPAVEAIPGAPAVYEPVVIDCPVIEPPVVVPPVVTPPVTSPPVTLAPTAPPAVVTPAPVAITPVVTPKPAVPELAATGASDVVAIGAGALILLVLGTIIFAAARRNR